MQEEILSLRLRISEQEEVLKGTIQRLRNTSRTKESMEHFIVNQCKCSSAAKHLQQGCFGFFLIYAENPEPFRSISPGIMM